MKTLYLMRHGQTLFNLRGKIQGACDSPLTDEGIKQAEIVRDYFIDHEINFDFAYSSTQERAVDTAEIVCSYKNVAHLKGIKEWNFGLFEGESEQLNPKIKEGETSYGDFFVDYGGESSEQVQKRMNSTLIEVMENENHNTILCVSHGGAMYRFIQKWVSQERIKNIKFINCCILKFDYSEGEFEFKEAISLID
ncbi:histidine phosphatase family protein [Brochothrix thermosphacta]|uniref:histidine phosphatase family protein n=1 Tax=Brochothrix thermosphacta TaxID=2756 RepID=UPI00083F65C1|nr:histidine phosphatase family protein [Brochothrix thermosphacta]ODJ60061.1 phosphoglycerate mutase [Brochothrix thermosphacta]